MGLDPCSWLCRKRRYGQVRVENGNSSYRFVDSPTFTTFSSELGLFDGNYHPDVCTKFLYKKCKACISCLCCGNLKGLLIHFRSVENLCTHSDSFSLSRPCRDYCFDPFLYPNALHSGPEDCSLERPCRKCEGVSDSE